VISSGLPSICRHDRFATTHVSNAGSEGEALPKSDQSLAETVTARSPITHSRGYLAGEADPEHSRGSLERDAEPQHSRGFLAGEPLTDPY
jgi:hypothetical protein